MLSTFRRFTKKIRAGCDRGVTLISYALVVSLIAVVSMVTVQAFGLNVSALFGNTGTQFDAIGVTTTTTIPGPTAAEIAAWNAQWDQTGDFANSQWYTISSSASAAAAQYPLDVNTYTVPVGIWSYGSVPPQTVWAGSTPSFTQASIDAGAPYYYFKQLSSPTPSGYGSTYLGPGIFTALPGDPLYPIAPIP